MLRDNDGRAQRKGEFVERVGPFGSVFFVCARH